MYILVELAVGEDRVWIIYIKPLYTDVDLHHLFAAAGSADEMRDILIQKVLYAGQDQG